MYQTCPKHSLGLIPTTLWGQHKHSPHLTDGKTKPQRCQVTWKEASSSAFSPLPFGPIMSLLTCPVTSRRLLSSVHLS